MKNSLKLVIILFLGVSQIALAQNTISGTIRDGNGPLPGANVIEVDPFHDFAKGSVAIRLIGDVSFGLLNPNAFCSIKSA